MMTPKRRTIRKPQYSLVQRAHNAVKFAAHEEQLISIGWRFDKTDPKVWWAVCGSRGMYVAPGTLMVDQTGDETFYRSAKELFEWMQEVAWAEASNLEEDFRRAKSG